jgi:hypothetical protein
MKRRTTASEHEPRRVYGRPFPKGVSGNPLGRGIKGHRFSELQKALSSDYGGVDALTPFQKILLTQSCRLLMRSEKARDLDMQVRLSNASMRWPPCSAAALIRVHRRLSRRRRRWTTCCDSLRTARHDKGDAA